jgi:hypothetical protein
MRISSRLSLLIATACGWPWSAQAQVPELLTVKPPIRYALPYDLELVFGVAPGRYFSVGFADRFVDQRPVKARSTSAGIITSKVPGRTSSVSFHLALEADNFVGNTVNARAKFASKILTPGKYESGPVVSSGGSFTLLMGPKQAPLASVFIENGFTAGSPVGENLPDGIYQVCLVRQLDGPDHALKPLPLVTVYLALAQTQDELFKLVGGKCLIQEFKFTPDYDDPEGGRSQASD